MYNRRKENLFPIITINVYTQDYGDREIHLNTYIYSDYFSAYRENYFDILDFVLHQVNRNVWFGQWRFHTITILKRWSNNFSGLLKL